jgi:hypothetical protein
MGAAGSMLIRPFVATLVSRGGENPRGGSLVVEVHNFGREGVLLPLWYPAELIIVSRFGEVILEELSHGAQLSTFFLNAGTLP